MKINKWKADQILELISKLSYKFIKIKLLKNNKVKKKYNLQVLVRMNLHFLIFVKILVLYNLLKEMPTQLKYLLIKTKLNNMKF